MPGPTTLSPTQASPWPDPRQLLLLKAALLTGDQAARAWEQWKASFRFEDPLDEGSFRILPLLYHNLRVLAPEDPLLPRLKGTWKQAWYRNQKLFHEGAAVLRKLHDQGIRTILLKGAALSLHFYDDIALRPMSDLDILVPASQARQAIAVLTLHGWTAEDPGGLEYNLRYGRSMGFRRPCSAELDLHWHPFFELPDEASEGLWEHAIPSGLPAKLHRPLTRQPPCCM